MLVFVEQQVERALVPLLDALHDAGVPLSNTPIRLVGGGSRSAAYRQILADLAERPVQTVSGEEHVAKGACVQATAALAGVNPDQVIEALLPHYLEIQVYQTILEALASLLMWHNLVNARCQS